MSIIRLKNSICKTKKLPKEFFKIFDGLAGIEPAP